MRYRSKISMHTYAMRTGRVNFKISMCGEIERSVRSIDPRASCGGTDVGRSSREQKRERALNEPCVGLAIGAQNSIRRTLQASAVVVGARC